MYSTASHPCWASFGPMRVGSHPGPACSSHHPDQPLPMNCLDGGAAEAEAEVRPRGKLGEAEVAEVVEVVLGH